VLVAFRVRHAMRMRHVVIYGLSTYKYYLTLSRHDFQKKNRIYSVCLDFLYKFIQNIFYSKKNSARPYHK
jgi:hypothetical protein